MGRAAYPALTICIPCYNVDVRPLLVSLKPAINAYTYHCVVLLGDDCSSEFWGKEYDRLANDRLLNELIVYHALENIGRGGMRNHLAHMATTDWVLFIDADSEVEMISYLKTYFDVVIGDPDVVVGGTCYALSKPTIGELRWNYGRKYEQILPDVRNQNRYRSLALNNVFVKRSVLLSCPIPELNYYGHEDTLWGLELKMKGIEVIHILNPVRHIGLERDAEFVSKSVEAAKNLRQLVEAGSLDRSATTLSRYGDWLKVIPFMSHFFIAFSWLCRKAGYPVNSLQLLKLAAYLRG
jgi:glycosyltransferase involved in cell wall biosynthesis